MDRGPTSSHCAWKHIKNTSFPFQSAAHTVSVPPTWSALPPSSALFAHSNIQICFTCVCKVYEHARTVRTARHVAEQCHLFEVFGGGEEGGFPFETRATHNRSNRISIACHVCTIKYVLLCCDLGDQSNINDEYTYIGLLDRVYMQRWSIPNIIFT